MMVCVSIERDGQMFYCVVGALVDALGNQIASYSYNPWIPLNSPEVRPENGI